MNSFPSDFNSNLSGFGGNRSKNRSQHRDEIKKTPIILVHGNASHSDDTTFGMLKMKEFLREFRYQDIEIWAPDYLGEGNKSPIIQNVHIDRIDRLRTFIDKVKDYLGVKKLDFIAHSLGCGMVNGYLRGLQSNETWKNNDDHRFDVVSTFVALAGATYGLGPRAQDEFMTGSRFERESHNFKDIADDTPFGSRDPSKQIAPPPPIQWEPPPPSPVWTKSTTLDNDTVRYVAIVARNDFVDQQKRNTSLREGADLNKVFNLGIGLQGHEKIIKDQGVFDAFKDYLNQNPPKPAVTINVDKVSGNYDSPLEIAVEVTPHNIPAEFTAERIIKEFRTGFIERTVVETNNGQISHGKTLTLVTHGAWEVVFSADGAKEVARTYGVDVHIPEVTIATDNGTPFRNNLEVRANTTKGTVFHSFDEKHWNAGADVTITGTTKIYFMAIDEDGLPSATVSRLYEKIADIQSVTATLVAHFLANRLTAPQFSSLFTQFGSNATVTLFFINGEWVLNSETQAVSAMAPTVALSAESGVRAEALTVALTARHDVDAAPKIYYTLDGSLPTENSSYFSSSGLLKFDTKGTRTLKYRARDASGNWSDIEEQTYTMNIKDASPSLSADKPSGDYAKGFDVTISAFDDVDDKVTVFYTEDGSEPADAKNRNRLSFVDKKKFSINGNGNHSVFCYTKNSTGKETWQPFFWSIDDQAYPETSLSPSMGGIYVGKVDIELSASEKCAWTKYTMDGSIPSETNGDTYAGPIRLEENTVLKFCSKDIQGNMEPVKTAAFTITRQAQEMVFDNRADRDGYVKARPNGSDALVGTLENLAIGSSKDSKDCRAILSFDTASLPDNVKINKAYVTVKPHSTSGDVWSDERRISVDIQHGYFGSSKAIQADDWSVAATAEEVAFIEKFSSETARSSDFSQAGMDAINKTGVTQIRLRVNTPHTSSNNCLFIKGGGDAKLIVEYESVNA